MKYIVTPAYQCCGKALLLSALLDPRRCTTIAAKRAILATDIRCIWSHYPDCNVRTTRRQRRLSNVNPLTLARW